MNVKPPSLDPQRTICVCKHNGKEVGRVPAPASNAREFIMELAHQYGELQVDHEEDQDAWIFAAIWGSK